MCHLEQALSLGPRSNKVLHNCASTGLLGGDGKCGGRCFPLSIGALQEDSQLFPIHIPTQFPSCCTTPQLRSNSLFATPRKLSTVSKLPCLDQRKTNAVSLPRSPSSDGWLRAAPGVRSWVLSKCESHSCVCSNTSEHLPGTAHLAAVCPQAAGVFQGHNAN